VVGADDDVGEPVAVHITRRGYHSTKPVTILFTDIVGSTAIAESLDPEEWKEIVSGAHQRVGQAIYRYEGTVARLMGDGILAFFGAPIAHEDDPQRALLAGLEPEDVHAVLHTTC